MQSLTINYQLFLVPTALRIISQDHAQCIIVKATRKLVGVM